MTFEEFDEIVQRILKQVEDNKKKVKKDTQNIMRPVPTEISS